MQPEQNPFDFIIDPSQQRRSNGPAFLQNPKNRIIVGIIFVVIILTVLLVGFSLITSIGKKSADDLISVAAYQTEIARISDLGLKSAKDSSTKSKLSTISAFISTDSQSTISYIGSTGTKISKEQIAQSLDPKVDKELETASQLNRYDETLLKILETKSTAYKLSLQKAISAASNPSEKKILDNAANNILTYEGTDVTKN